MSELYKKAGVDIHVGDETVDWLKGLREIRPSHQYGAPVMGIGGFASLYRVDFKSLKEPALVSSTDGVGTKVLLAQDNSRELSGLGIDLVAMCVNDLYTLGATPLFFLDYFATGKLEPDQFKQVIAGIHQGLSQAQCPLVGGETAEMPGMYGPGHFDLAGFVVGVVDQAAMWGPHQVNHGDELWGFTSSGFHSNGFSLIRRWIDAHPKDKKDPILMAKLLAPTKIYSELLQLKPFIKAAAHITGGGISGNLPRVVPKGAKCIIKQSLIPTPDWMGEFIGKNKGSFKEVEPVFNLGVGMIVAVNQSDKDGFLKSTAISGQSPIFLGHIELDTSSTKDAEVIYV